MRRPSRGKTIVGVAVSPVKFQGVSTLSELESFGLVRPTIAAKADKNHSDLEKSAHIERKHVQRPFDKSRIKHAEEYRDYIKFVEVDHQPGGVPAITLYTAAAGAETDEGLMLPHNASITAIDGETQTEARYMLREMYLETGDNLISVTVYHGLSHDHAQQILSDYNALGHPISVKQTAQMNKTGPLTQAALEAAKRNSIDPDLINNRGATGNKKCYASYAQIFHGMAGADANGFALTRKMSKVTETLNRPFGLPIRSEIIQIGTRLLSDCVEPGSSARAAPALVWQVAGHLLASGERSHIEWSAGIAAYRRFIRKDGVALEDGGLATKLSAIAQAL